MKFPNRLVLSAMAGINDWNFVKKFEAGFVILGGFNADKRSMEAGIRAVKRGRREFIFSDPILGIKDQLERAENSGKIIGVNVRSATLEGYVDTAKTVRDYGAVFEINAHCRQPEFMEIGCGQSLLFNPEKLYEIVRSTSKYCEVIVKIRGGLGVDYLKLTEGIFSEGAFMIHVDAMIPNGGADLKLVKALSEKGNIIGNNSVRDVESAKKMIEQGAKLVSLARMALSDRDIFKKLLRDDVLASKIEVI